VAPSVQRRKVWLTPTTTVPCSNAAKTRNPLKYAGVPQTPEPISAISQSSPYSEDMWRRYCCLTSFFSDCQFVPQLRRYNPTKSCDGAQMAIFLCHLLWSPYVIGQTIIFSSCFLFFFLFFPRLISVVGDWMLTILWHMVWPYCEFRMQV